MAAAGSFRGPYVRSIEPCKGIHPGTEKRRKGASLEAMISLVRMVPGDGIGPNVRTSQTSDVGSIPIARSINSDDSVDLTRASFWKATGKSSSVLLVLRWETARRRSDGYTFVY